MKLRKILPFVPIALVLGFILGVALIYPVNTFPAP